MVHTFRLKPGDDLRQGLEEFFQANNLKAASIVTCVGSIDRLSMRMAGASPGLQDNRVIKGCYEIVSLVGTIGKDGSHIHISVSDTKGRVIGGHLKNGSRIHTTAEIVLVESSEELYKRELDPETGFKELTVRHD